MRHPPRLAAALIVLCAPLVGCGSTRAVNARHNGDARGATWAVPMRCAGVPNFHKVDNRLYRGGQPSAEGFRELERMGIKTVINVRSMESDEELLKGTNLRYIEIPTSSYTIDEGDLAAFLAAVNDPKGGPYFVHCHHGADRTGAMVAAYRVVYSGWSSSDAEAEMREGGFNFHEVCVRLAPLVRGLERAELCRLAGIQVPGRDPHSAVAAAANRDAANIPPALVAP